MSKEKNKNTFRIGALLLVACLISSVMLSGTFAKYTSEYAGQDTALVAKWSLDVKDGEGADFAISPNAAAELDLFLHEYDKNILSTAGDDKIIAPGVGGNFVLNLTNNSDVAADILFEISESGPVFPIEFAISDVAFDFDNAEPEDILVGIEDLDAALDALTIHLDEAGGDDAMRVVTVYWRWAYDNIDTEGWKDLYDDDLNTDNELGEDYIANADAADTALGVDSASGASRTEYTLNIKVTATQSEPEVI
jgi:hypothetical protein